MSPLASALTSILFGFITGLASAYIFAHWLYSKRKPHLEIGEFIACRDDGKFAIKVINESRYAAIDIRARLTEVRNRELDTGVMKVNCPIQLENPDVFMLEADTDDRKRSDDPGAIFVWRFKTTDDLEERLENGATVRLQVIAQNAFSNATGVALRTYTRTSLKEGNYKVGHSLEVE